MPETEVIETQAIEPSRNVQLILKAELDSAIATAKQYPRDITRFKDKAMSMATNDTETAKGCFYNIPRKGTKGIQGPSVRLAEIMLTSYGNIAAEAEIIAEDDKFVTARGRCRDLENNNMVSVNINRRIVDKNGKRFSDDMIGVTKNAANAVALRNAIFSIIPKVFTQQVYEACKDLAIGKGRALEDRRQDALSYFDKVGISRENVFRLLDVPGIDDINNKEIEVLIGMANALRDGDTTIDDLLSQLEDDASGSDNGTLDAGDHHDEPRKPPPTAKPKSKSTRKEKTNDKPVNPINPADVQKETWAMLSTTIRNRCKRLGYEERWHEVLVHFSGDLAAGYGDEQGRYPSVDEMTIWLDNLGELTDDELRKICGETTELFDED